MQTACGSLRDYQLRAVHTLQRSVEEGNDRFLFEMATGTGKTLTAAAIINCFCAPAMRAGCSFCGSTRA